MFGVIGYVAICATIAGVITVLYALTRPVHVRDDFKSWRVWCILFLIALSLPYASFEVMTKTVGKDMANAVQAGVDEAKIEGDLKYYKVLFTDGKKASILAVCEEDSSWGGKDRPVVRLSLVKNEKKNKWTVDSQDIIYSDNRNKDGIVFPPFW